MPPVGRNLLQAVNLSAQTQGLSSKALPYRRRHGPRAQRRAVTLATDPCFFQGCGPVYSAVGLPAYRPSCTRTQGGSTPAAAFCEYLEVQIRVTSQPESALFRRNLLIGGFAQGFLACKLPFQGRSSMRKVSK